MERGRLIAVHLRAAALVAGASVLLSLAAPACTDSLYAAAKNRSMFADRKARAIGDVITVLVTESTVAQQDADSNARRSFSAEADGGVDSWGIFKLVPSASLSGSASHQGSGSTTRSSRLISTITCRIEQITPSGQLVLNGERRLKMNADTQTLKFTGLVRPDDVGPNNTVASTSVADAQIEVIGKGPIDRGVKPGFLSRIFDFLF
jgi:flagellar L-ring protein precursor FlgH